MSAVDVSLAKLKGELHAITSSSLEEMNALMAEAHEFQDKAAAEQVPTSALLKKVIFKYFYFSISSRLIFFAPLSFPSHYYSCI